MSTNANTETSQMQASGPPAAKMMGATVDSWSGTKGGQYKRDIVGAASHGGYCYLKLLYYFNWFDSETDNDENKFDDLEFYIMCLKDRLGPEPEGLKVLTELAVAGHNYLSGKPLYFDIEEGMVGVTSVAAIFDMMKESKARVDFDQVDGIIHLKGSPTFCGCEGPVCQHGWTYVALSVIITKPGRKIGASNFDMDAFLRGGVFDQDQEDEDEFLETYSILELSQDQKAGIRGWVPKPLSVIGEMPEEERQPFEAPQRTDQTPGEPHKMPSRPKEKARRVSNNSDRPSDTLRKTMHETVQHLMRLEEVKRNQKLKNLQEEIIQLRQQLMNAEVDSPSPRAKDDVASTILETDSSSQVGRYTSDRKFLNHGTVLAPTSPHTEHGKMSGETVMTVSESLVSGFYQNEETRQRENEHVRKLRPINGLPKPFLSSRLNFLANFHTGLIRCLAKRPEEPVRCLFSFMRTTPSIPVDDLLHQVLSVSVDRHEFVYASNPFKLPYIEVGMLVTEESIAKMLDLLTGEYKGLWFQEMKGLSVPDFHSEFLNKSHDPVERQYRKSRDEGKQISHRPPPQRQGKRSILGF
nr:MAG: nonstructural protein [Leptosphaeria biglobosa negative ssRNA virus 3]UYL94509.1 MAG: nonstructural protein [Leptosphaeria biglobosa negative single-stranded RNA virus 8]